MNDMNLLSRWEEVYLLSIWELEDNAYGVSIKKTCRKKPENCCLMEGCTFLLDN